MLILGDLALGAAFSTKSTLNPAFESLPSPEQKSMEQEPDSGKQGLQKLAKVMDVDLLIQISADKSQADPGDAIFYTIRYRNRGTETAENVTITVYAPNYSAEAY